MKGILGKKLGMTQVFDDSGNVVPVTIIEAGPCTVVATRTAEKNGYKAVQLGLYEVPEKKADHKLGKPLSGIFKKAGVKPQRTLREVQVHDPENYNVGQTLTCEIFEAGQKVDVIGTSKGKGFAGTMKRYHFGGGPRSHGSMTHRQPCASGSTDSARTFKGTRKPGHLGHARTTVQGLKVVRVDAAKNLLLIKGAVPGPTNGLVLVRDSVKK